MLSCFNCVWLFGTLWTIAHQVPLSMGFSRLEWVAVLSSRGSSQPRDPHPGWGFIVSPKYMCSQNLRRWPYGNIVLADVIKYLEIMMDLEWILTCPFEKKGTQRQREGAMWRQRQRQEWCGHKPRNARNHQRLEEAEKDSLLEMLEGVRPCWQCDFRCLATRNERESAFIVFTHQVCVISSDHPGKPIPQYYRYLNSHPPFWRGASFQ